jgi:hemoglobin-like flavoprotein
VLFSARKALPVVMETFYVRLFELDASVKPLFSKTDMTKQALATGNTISAAVDGLDNLSALVPVLQVCTSVQLAWAACFKSNI